MAYCSASDVASHTRNILGAEGIFSTSTSPNINSVNSWMSAGCALIEMKLTSCRYSVPVTAGTVGYDMLKHLNAIYAAGWAELSRTNVTLSTQERTRGQVLLAEFQTGLDSLCDMDLTGAGISRSSKGKVYVGGISVSEKQRIESDTDRVRPRFSKGQFRFPETLEPDATTAS